MIKWIIMDFYHSKITSNINNLQMKDVLWWSMNVHQALITERQFLSSRQGSNPQPSDDRWDAVTIDLPRLR